MTAEMIYGAVALVGLLMLAVRWPHYVVLVLGLGLAGQGLWASSPMLIAAGIVVIALALVIDKLVVIATMLRKMVGETGQGEAKEKGEKLGPAKGFLRRMTGR